MRSAETKCGEALRGCVISPALKGVSPIVSLQLAPRSPWHCLTGWWWSGAQGYRRVTGITHRQRTGQVQTHTLKQKHGRHREHMAAFFCRSCSSLMWSPAEAPPSLMVVFALKLFSPPGPENMDQAWIETRSLQNVAQMHFGRVHPILLVKWHVSWRQGGLLFLRCVLVPFLFFFLVI